MNMLIDALPEKVEIDGKEYAINTNFFIGVQFELLMQDQDIPENDKFFMALDLYYPEIPPNLSAAVERLLWFYRCGADNAERPAENATPKKAKKAYCFDQDDRLIYAAFLDQYGIDLNAIPYLHWWKFRALFYSLSENCLFSKIMGYRTADTNGMAKSQKQHYAKMAKLYALRNTTKADEALSLANRDRHMRAYIAGRYEETGGDSN